ncbi:hypothetical protein ACV07N_07050 [Roseivirga echinicomitans]
MKNLKKLTIALTLGFSMFMGLTSAEPLMAMFSNPDDDLLKCHAAFYTIEGKTARRCGYCDILQNKLGGTYVGWCPGVPE